MSNTILIGRRISELPEGTSIAETDIFPATLNLSTTNKVTLTDIRNALNFDYAFLDTATALAKTKTGDFFFVFTDDTLSWVTQYFNSNGVASAVLTNGVSMNYPTAATVSTALTKLNNMGNGLFSKTVTFSAGMAYGIPTDFVNPSRGRKRVIIESSGNDGPISEFIITKVSVNGIGSVETVFESSPGSHVISWPVGQNGQLSLRSTVAGTFSITLI